MGWFAPLQSLSDVEKGTPSNNDILVYNTTTRLWELANRSTFGSTDAVYLGDPLTDGTWRIIRSGTSLKFQRLESSSWVEKGSMDV
jgi:hypothetical protein